MKKYNLILAIFTIATLVGCVNPDTYRTPEFLGVCGDLSANKAVQAITSVSNGTTTKYTGDDIIEAYVTSSDLGGNFYKSISLVSVDGTVGFSMPIDDYNLYTKFEPGRKVYINMKDRYFNKQYGSTVIGSLFNNDTPSIPGDDKVGRISGAEYQNIITASCSSFVKEETLLNKLTVTQAKSDANLNKLIELDNVQFTDESLGKKFYDTSVFTIGGATNHQIIDTNGATVIVRISQYATFANESIPSGSGKIVGVMTKYGSDYQFMVRTKNDINLTEGRLSFDFFPPIGGTNLTYVSSLNETFTAYTTNLQVFPEYINDAVVGSRYWQVKAFNLNNYIQMTSYGGTPEANRALFMVPVNFTAASVFSFKSKAGFSNGNCLKVYYTTDYVQGANTTNATFTDITANFVLSPGSSTGYPTNFTNSNNYNIPAGITGTGFFVFEYTGNGTGITTTMQIDDIVIN